MIFTSGSGQNYLHFIRNTVIFTVATIVLKTAIALGLAVLLTRGIKRLAYFHRVVMYLPAVLPMLVVAWSSNRSSTQPPACSTYRCAASGWAFWRRGGWWTCIGRCPP